MASMVLVGCAAEAKVSKPIFVFWLHGMKELGIAVSYV